jgi:hypothetical protein
MSDPLIKKGTLIIRAGQPLQFQEGPTTDALSRPSPSIAKTVGVTLKAYLTAARNLLEGKYLSQKDLVPTHFSQLCDVFIIRFSDGMLVRYDSASQASQEKGKPRILCGEINASLSEAAPQFSEQVIHFPADPATYVPPPGGSEVIFSTIDTATGIQQEIQRLHFAIYATTKLPDEFQMPLPPMRPPCLVSLTNDINIQLLGVLEPTDVPRRSVTSETQQMLINSNLKLSVGWQAIEIYPPLNDEYWKPEYATMWAELDILAKIAEQNARISALHALDSRGATRQYYAKLLYDFDQLLNGPEEPAHQFLKAHPELLCPTHDAVWSKLAFGARVSDFVFREPHNDYLLVEIEAPYRELFRKDGQQREQLTHAIDQITDWIQHISENRQQVEQQLGLIGISTNPRTMVVIGRSADLTNENRNKISVLQAQHNKLRILTYDDMIASARKNLERILGPLDLHGQNVEIYYYK